MREQLGRLGMGLEDRLKAQVNKLSGGQRQAMSLLMATVAEPSLLLLDEHTAALDPKVAATIMDLTGEIVAERELTTLMVTHNMELALRYGDRLIMMHAGRIILDLTAAQKRTLQVERPHREVPRGRRRGVRRRPHAARRARNVVERPRRTRVCVGGRSTSSSAAGFGGRGSDDLIQPLRGAVGQRLGAMGREDVLDERRGARLLARALRRPGVEGARARTAAA